MSVAPRWEKLQAGHVDGATLRPRLGSTGVGHIRGIEGIPADDPARGVRCLYHMRVGLGIVSRFKVRLGSHDILQGSALPKIGLETRRGKWPVAIDRRDDREPARIDARIAS